MCIQEGRDCIEMNANRNFNCSVSCEGIYADAQWTEEALNSIKDEVLDEEDENAQSLSGMDNLRRLIKEYKELKKKNVRHVRFDVTSNTSTYGENVSTIIQLSLYQ